MTLTLAAGCRGARDGPEGARSARIESVHPCGPTDIDTALFGRAADTKAPEDDGVHGRLTESVPLDYWLSR